MKLFFMLVSKDLHIYTEYLRCTIDNHVICKKLKDDSAVSSDNILTFDLFFLLETLVSNKI